MKLFHVEVTKEDDWFIGRVLEREGVTTQGRSLDELVFMVRDAIHAMWNLTNIQLELVVPQDAVTTFKGRKVGGNGSRGGRRKRIVAAD
jgi:predicted RNase H-like HicB family nuclease